jgi:hypothetical protein
MKEREKVLQTEKLTDQHWDPLMVNMKAVMWATKKEIVWESRKVTMMEMMKVTMTG